MLKVNQNVNEINNLYFFAQQNKKKQPEIID